MGESGDVMPDNAVSFLQKFGPWLASFLFGGASGMAGSKFVLSRYGKDIEDHEERMRKMEQILAKLNTIETVQKTVTNGHEGRISKLETAGDALLTEAAHDKICRANQAELLMSLDQTIDKRISQMENRMDKVITLLKENN